MPVNVLSSSGNPIRFSDLNKLMNRYNSGISSNSAISSSGFRQFITKNIGNTSSLTPNIGAAVIDSKARGGKLINDDDPNLLLVGTDRFVIRSNPIKVSEFYQGQFLSASFKIVGSDISNRGFIITRFDSSSVINSTDGYKYFKYIFEATSSKIVIKKTNNPSPPGGSGYTNIGVQHTQSFKRPNISTKISLIDGTSNAFTSSFFNAYTGSGGGGGGGGGGAIGCGSGSVKATGIDTSTVVNTYGDSNTAGVSVIVINNVGGPTKYFTQQNNNYTFISSYIAGTRHTRCRLSPNIQTYGLGPVDRFAHVMYRPATSTSTLGIVDGHFVDSNNALLLSCPISTYENSSAVSGPLKLKLWKVKMYTTHTGTATHIRFLFTYTSQILTDLLTRPNNQTALFGESNLSKIPIPAINPTTNFQSLTGANNFSQFNTFFGYFGFKKSGFFLQHNRIYDAYAELPSDATNFTAIPPSSYNNSIDGVIHGTPVNTGYDIDESTDFLELNARNFNIGRTASGTPDGELVKTNTLVKRIFNGIMGSPSDAPGFSINYRTR